jgi:hypothetical protein
MLDAATHIECLGFIRATIAEADRTTAHHFAKRIKDAIGWNSPGVALGIDCALEDAIDRGELVAADVVPVVGDRHFLEFQELVARCPRWFPDSDFYLPLCTTSFQQNT